MTSMTFVPQDTPATTDHSSSRSTSLAANDHQRRPRFRFLSHRFCIPHQTSYPDRNKFLCLFIYSFAIVYVRLPLHHDDDDNTTKTRRFKHAIEMDPPHGNFRCVHRDNMYACVYNPCTKEYSTFSNNTLDGRTHQEGIVT